MRFMFSFISNITYTIFCLCIQFIILYIYRIFLSSTPDMLSVSVVTMLLFFCVFTYVVCIVLMLVFGIEIFSSDSDQKLDIAVKAKNQSTVDTEQPWAPWVYLQIRYHLLRTSWKPFLTLPQHIRLWSVPRSFQSFLDCIFGFRSSPFGILSSSSLSFHAPPALRLMSAARICCQTFAPVFCPCHILFQFPFAFVTAALAAVPTIITT